MPYKLHKEATENYRILLEFSRGRIPYRKLMADLQLETDEDLFLMMCAAELPMPTLSEETLDSMSRILENIHA